MALWPYCQYPSDTKLIICLVDYDVIKPGGRESTGFRVLGNVSFTPPEAS